MRPQCIQQVEQAIGRALRKGEADAIEAKISYHIRDLARTDPTAFNAMTEPQRQLAAAQAAMADHVAQVDKQAQRKAQNLLAQTRELENQKARAKVFAKKKEPYHAALFERLRQLDSRMKGERNRAFSSIIDVIEAASPRFLGLIANRGAERDFVREVFGAATGNQTMAKASKVWREQMDSLVNRLNAAGAMVGKLDYGWLPQPHDVRRVLRAGRDAWTSYVLPRLDRRRYLNEDGTQMNDASLIEFLNAAHETLRTDGLNKITPGAQRGGSRAGRFDDAHRQIHFKDGDAYLDYMGRFGPSSVFEAMRNSVNGLVKDIVLMEQFGPNTAQTYRLLRDTAAKQDSGTDRLFSGMELMATPDMVWDTLNGSLSTPVSSRWADFNQGIRNFMVAAKLQSTLLTSIFSDQSTLAVTAGYNHVSYGQSLLNTFKSLSPNYRKDAALMAMTMDSIAGDLVAIHTNNLAQGWTGKLANATMKATLLEGMTNAVRRGFSVLVMNRLAGDTRKAWGADAQLQRRLEEYGINETDWKVWQAAEPENWRGQKMLTPESITRLEGFSQREINDAIGKLLGYVQEESEFTSINPGLMTRATIRQGTQAGTLGGEGLRHTMLFKSFAVAMIERHWKRIERMESNQGRLAYGAALASLAILSGALTNQLMDVSNGRDPRDMTTKEFWLKAALRSGGLAILGDIFYTGLGGENAGGQPNLTGLLGPVAGTAADVGMTLGSVFKKKTEPADVGANLLRIGWQNTPLLRSWYTKAAIEHALIHDMQENLSPGYLRRMEKKAQRDFNQQFWWRPGGTAPRRSPDLGAATGQ